MPLTPMEEFIDFLTEGFCILLFCLLMIGIPFGLAYSLVWLFGGV